MSLAFHHIAKNFLQIFRSAKSHIAIPLPSSLSVARRWPVWPGHAFELAAVALELLCGLAKVWLEVIDGLGFFQLGTPSVWSKDTKKKQRNKHEEKKQQIITDNHK